MPTNTYVALDKVTVSGSSTTSINFNSISSAYTDLVIVCSAANTTTSTNMLARFNSDSTSVYSQTTVSGTGTTTGSNRYSNQSAIYLIERHEMTSAANSYSTSIIHINNYSKTNMFKTTLSRSGTVNSTAAGTDLTIGLWRSTSAITSITLLVNSGAFAAGSTFSLYGIQAQSSPGTAKATGGTITYDNSGNVIHTFTSSGTFTPSQALSVEYLVIAGGGGGNGGKAAQFAGAGGGAGTGYASSLSLTTTAYTVEVGAGGAGGPFNTGKGGDGTSSIFASITATGGTGVAFDSRTGGSNALYSGGTTTGNPAGGGAGSAANGVDINGGNGISSSISGSWVTRGGGGSAAGGTPGTGGGGQGRSGSQAGGAGSANTGSGGGGAGDAFSGGAGGSGIVIVRYSGL